MSKVEKKEPNEGSRLPAERIIMGLDPGTGVMGYGIIKVRGNSLKLLQFGVIQLSKYESHELRLKKIFDRVLSLVDEFNPDERLESAADRIPASTSPESPAGI